MARKVTLTFVCVFILLMPARTRGMGAIDDVRRTLKGWQAAWQSKDMAAFRAFYSLDFHAAGSDYDDWMEKKAQVWARSRQIAVELSDMSVLVEGRQATARFIQHYREDAVNDVGEKVLELVRSEEGWKIVAEQWAPLPRTAPAESPPVAAAAGPADAPQGPPRSSGADDAAVRGIRYQLAADVEKVLVDLNLSTMPVFFTLDEPRPRVVIDIQPVYDWSGPAKLPVNGRWIRGIRTYLHRPLNKLRIVVDLTPSLDYLLGEIYDMATRTYCVEIGAAH